MRKVLFMALSALVLMSCGTGNERLLTSATGSIYECLVVCDNGIKDEVSETMGADLYGLPQMEATFTVSHVTPGQFDNLVKGSRNILLVDLNDNKYTQVQAKKSRDVWSTPQAMVRIQAPDAEAFTAYWRENGAAIREWFVQEEIARQIRFYRANTNKDARAILNKQGYDILIPEDFVLVKHSVISIQPSDSVDVVWCCNNKGPMRKDIVVYSYPYTSQDQFSNKSLIAMRNAVLGQLVTAQLEGSHMSTEMKHFPPVSRSVQAPRDTIGGFYGIETRGLWKIVNGEAMGGPYVSLTRLDQVNGRVVTAEAFLYAAGQKKRNAMRQSESILYTLKMPNER